MISCSFSPGRMPTILCGSVRAPWRAARSTMLHRGNLRHEDLAAVHALEALEHEVDALLQRDPEARHARVGDRQVGRALRRCSLLEERHHRAARADHVAVAHHGEARAVPAGDVVGGDEQLVGGQLGGAVEIDRVGRLVGRQRDDLLDARSRAPRGSRSRRRGCWS